MPRDPNPYEPWRPRPGDHPLSSVDPLRPWRPRRAAEPAAPVPLPSKAEPPRPAASPPPVQPPGFEPDPGRQAVLVLLLLLLATGTVALAALGSAHFGRVFLALAALGAGWGVSISLARRRPWRERLAWVGAGVLAALAVRWFVPTFAGVSLLDAGRLAAETEAIPTGDVSTYTAAARYRKAAVSEFPEYAAEIRAAESAWVRRTADAAIESSGARIERDPVGASRDLWLLVQSLNRLDHWAEVRDDLQAVRQKALRARGQWVARELEVLVAHGAFDTVPAAATRALVEIHDEAREVGVYDEVAGMLAPLRRQSLRARLDAVVRELEAAAARGEFTAVTRRGEKALAELSGEAREIGIEEDVRQRLLHVRRKAVLAALDAARSEAMLLAARDRFQAVAALGEQLARVLAGEAQAVGATADLEQFRQACQVFGDLARQAGKPDAN